MRDHIPDRHRCEPAAGGALDDIDLWTIVYHDPRASSAGERAVHRAEIIDHARAIDNGRVIDNEAAFVEVIVKMVEIHE